MSQLLAIIDEYKDAHGGPSDSSIARAIGVAPQTISSWRQRGIRQLPEKQTLVALAELVRRDYVSVVLAAVLEDIDYLPKESDGDDAASTNVSDLSDLTSRVAGEPLQRVAKKRPTKG